MAEKMIKRVIEALLFVSQKPLKAEDIRDALDGMEAEEIKKAIEELREEYKKEERSFDIAELAGGYQIVTKPEFAPWIGKLFKREESRLTGPSLETLAIIAWKNPANQSNVIKIRGNKAYGHIKYLEDAGLIGSKPKGKSRELKLTDKFYEYFDSSPKEVKEKFKQK